MRRVIFGALSVALVLGMCGSAWASTVLSEYTPGSGSSDWYNGAIKYYGIKDGSSGKVKIPGIGEYH